MSQTELRILMRKEWKQLLRSRAAMATSLVLPVLFFLVIPGSQMLALKAAPGNVVKLPDPHVRLPPGMEAFAHDPAAMLRFMLPLMMTLGGLIVPSVAATYTIISERETRTLELLVALPVRVTQVLLAKLIVITQMALIVTGSLFLVDAVALLVLKLASLWYVLALALVLVGALAYSTAAALLISLIGKDYRTANNVNGALIVPTIILTMAILMLVRGEIFHTVLLAVTLMGCAALGIWVAMKVITFERLLR